MKAYGVPIKTYSVVQIVHTQDDRTIVAILAGDAEIPRKYADSVEYGVRRVDLLAGTTHFMSPDEEGDLTGVEAKWTTW